MLSALVELLLILGSFAVLALAAKQIGDYFARYDLPLITGFLIAGILIGPYLLGLLSPEDLEKLRFVDEMALSVIALAAGAELFLPELRSRTGAILWVSFFQVVTVLGLGVLATRWLLPAFPGGNGLSAGAGVAFALLMGVILLARSPSSAIAVITELKAKGPFTRLVLGTTVVSDVVVLTLFAMALELARAWAVGGDLSPRFLLALGLDLALSVLIGWLFFRLLGWVFARRVPPWVKGSLVLLLGYGTFWLSGWVESASRDHLPLTFAPEPLLAGVLAAFWIVNRSPYRDEFTRLLATLSPVVFIAFFTLTGASLALDVLARVWPVALALFAVRLAGFALGSAVGGWLAGDPWRVAVASGLAFVTQAGVALGLAKKVADTFPAFGETFATVVVALVVLNQVVGPPLLKFALRWAGEVREGRRSRRRVWIFGDDDQAVALCRHFKREGWGVRLFSPDPDRVRTLKAQGLEAEPLESWEGEPPPEAALLLLTDDENLALCRRLSALGVGQAVARRQGHAPLPAYREAGCQVIDPTTATVHLLAQFVESPGAAALLLGEERGHQVLDLVVEDPALDGVPLRELRLPADVLVLAIHRGDEAIVTHGYTQLRLGDRVTVMGSPESLAEVALRFAPP